MKQSRNVSVFGLIGALALVSCSIPDGARVRLRDEPEAVAADASTESPPRDSRAPVANRDCWWLEQGEGELLAIWVSPRLEGQVPGGFRFVTVVRHDPDSKSPLMLHASPVQQTAGHPVRLSGGGVSMLAQPKDGKTWSQVVGRDDLEVRYVGPAAAKVQAPRDPGGR